MIYSAQSTGSFATNSSNWSEIPGLSLTIPGGVGLSALVILNLPNPYATGSDYPGGTFGISVNGTIQPAYASFTYDSAQPQSSGRKPTTLVVAVPLIEQPQTVQGMWQTVRNSTIHIDSPTTLSAIV